MNSNDRLLFRAAAFAMATTSLITGIIQITRDIEKIYANPPVGPKIIESTPQALPAKKSGYPIKQCECRICGRTGYTEWHHIISRGHAKKTNQLDLIDTQATLWSFARDAMTKLLLPSPDIFLRRSRRGGISGSGNHINRFNFLLLVV